MSGAGRLARDFVLRHARPAERVIELGAGRSDLAGALSEFGCQVTAIDRDREALEEAWHLAGRTYAILTLDLEVSALPGPVDLITAVYSLQHMLYFEPAVWVKCRGALRTGGRLIHVGRYALDSPALEGDRADPLFSSDGRTLETLSRLSGFELAELEFFRYDGAHYRSSGPEDANAFAGVWEAAKL